MPAEGETAVGGGEEGVEQGPPEWKRMKALPKPCTFEDLIAAFMADVVEYEQSRIEKMVNDYKSKYGIEGGASDANGKPKGAASKNIVGQGKDAAGQMLGSGDDAYEKMLGMIAQANPAAGAFIGIGKLAKGPLMSVGQSVTGVKVKNKEQTAKDDAKTETSRQMIFEDIKNAMNRLQQMQQSMSNVLNTMHQGSMNAIRNIK